MSSSIASRVPPASPSSSRGQKRKRDEIEADDWTLEADTWTLEAAAAHPPAIHWDGKDWTGLAPVKDPRDPIAWCSYLTWVAVSYRRSMLSAKQRAAQRAAERSNRGTGVAAPVPGDHLQSIAREVLALRAVLDGRKPPLSVEAPQCDTAGPAVPAGLANSDTEPVDLLARVLASQQASGQLESTESEAESEAPPPKKRTPLPNGRPQTPPAPAPAPVPDPGEHGLPTPLLTPPHIHASIYTTDPTWHSTPIPEPPAMPARRSNKETGEPEPLSDKTRAAYKQAMKIHEPGVRRHDAGPCMNCNNGRGDKARCVVNRNVKDGTICAPCVMKKEKCWYTLLTEAEVIDKTGEEADAPCEECLKKAEAGDDDHEPRCVVQKDGKGKTTACSACMKLGKRESCTLNSKPKKSKNGKPRDLAKE